MNKLIFLSFADSRMKEALQRIGREANNIKIFDDVVLMTEEELDGAFWNQFGVYCKSNKRGFGYWLWKSHILKVQLDKMKNGDFLVYCDAGCEINPRGKKKLLHYIDLAKKSSLGMCAFSTGLPEKLWSKGDIIDYLTVRNCQDIMDSPQFMGGIQIICKNERNVGFINEWEQICQNNLSLIDDSASKSFNMDGFIENRHDQSIFSILIKKYGGYAYIPDHEVDVWPNEPWRWHRLKYNPILAKRNKTGISTPFAPWYKRLFWDIIIICADVKNHMMKYAHSC